MNKTFYSHGKLLLSGEYLVIDGALGFALPTKFGQSLNVNSSDTEGIHWKSFDREGKCWLEVQLSKDLEIIETSSTEEGQWLRALLKSANDLSTLPVSSVSVDSYLEFPRNWGLGSSSTIIDLVAQVHDIDPFQLHFKVSNGSGYDIACARNDSALLYSNKPAPKVENVEFNPDFKKRIHFVHLNKKQVSSGQVASYNELKQSLNLKDIVQEVDNITLNIARAKNLNQFEQQLLEHELFMSNVLERSTISDSLFPGYEAGVIKSLGAWGGDFVMVTGNKSDLEYFKKLGFNTILSFEEMIFS